MDCLRGDGTEVIWSNVLIDENGIPHWVGNGEDMPKKGVNFQGEWHEGKTDADGKPIPMSHKNSRCTLLASAITNHATEGRRPGRRAGQGYHLFAAATPIPCRRSGLPGPQTKVWSSAHPSSPRPPPPKSAPLASSASPGPTRLSSPVPGRLHGRPVQVLQFRQVQRRRASRSWRGSTTS